MKDLYILDAGCISSVGDTLDSCWDKLGSEVELEKNYDFEVNMPPKLKRSSDRFSKMYMSVMEKLVNDNKETLDSYPAERIGTIFSSEYGPVTTNLLFAREVLEKDPEICSPAKFSNTVANACVGIACINHGYKGVSTMLQGSNSLSFSEDLINEGKADLIFSAFADEYSEEVVRALHEAGEEKRDYAENCSIFLVGDEKFKEKSICSIKKMVNMNLGSNTRENEATNERRIRKCIERCLSDGKPVDAVLHTSTDDRIGKLETRIMKDMFEEIPVSGKASKLVGDIMGSSINMNLVLGTMCLKKKELNEKLFDGVKASCKRILVTGYDILGNYSCVLLEAE